MAKGDKLLIITDLDDTLTPNESNYIHAKISLVEWLMNQEGFLDSRRQLYYRAQLDFERFLLDRIGFRAPDLQHMLNAEHALHETQGGRDMTRVSTIFRTLYSTIAKDALMTSTPVDEEIAYVTGVPALNARIEGIPDTAIAGVTPRDIVNLEVAIDKAAVKEMGVRMERYPTSFRKTYLALCEQAGFAPDPALAQRAYDIGMSAFDEERVRTLGLIPGAPSALRFLREQGHELALLTKGDVRVQRMKICALGLDEYFAPDHQFIVERKDAEQLEAIAKKFHYRARKVRHLGNSVRSDVYPAHEAGIGMWYIPCETWAYEREHEGIPEKWDVRTVPHIKQLPAMHDELLRRRRRCAIFKPSPAPLTPLEQMRSPDAPRESPPPAADAAPDVGDPA